MLLPNRVVGILPVIRPVPNVQYTARILPDSDQASRAEWRTRKREMHLTRQAMESGKHNGWARPFIATGSSGDNTQ